VANVKVQRSLESGLPAIPGKCGPATAGFSEPVPERQGRDERRRNFAPEHAERRLCQRARFDTGSGITQEHIQRIYDPSSHEDGSAEGQNRGTGLGLSVTYGIIQEHAGNIRVESRPGERDDIHLGFPLDQEGRPCLKLRSSLAEPCRIVCLIIWAASS